MSEKQFVNGYWYIDELKIFSKEIGISFASKLRKDELEKSIKRFLRTGKVILSSKRNLQKSGVKDSEIGLSLELPIINYTNNKETKEFLVKEAKTLVPELKEKSGVRYRLNRWREDEITKGTKITYGDLIKQYINLNQTAGPFSKIPSGRYINFLSEFLKGEKNSKRSQAIKAWENLKKWDAPKSYNEWKKLQKKKHRK